MLGCCKDTHYLRLLDDIESSRLLILQPRALHLILSLKLLCFVPRSVARAIINASDLDSTWQLHGLGVLSRYSLLTTMPSITSIRATSDLLC